MTASHTPFSRVLARLVVLALLAECQASAGVVAQPTQPAKPAEAPAPDSPDAALAAVPPCLDGITATPADGMKVRYKGAAPNDPEVCLVAWRGKVHRYLAGFWGGGRFRKGAPDERTAIRQALTGPLGTRTSFDDTHAGMWGRVTVEPVASPTIFVRGRPRNTVQLRVVRHDVRGRPNVRREALHWIDVRTGIAMKRQSVTRLSGERQVSTTWRVQQLTDTAS